MSTREEYCIVGEHASKPYHYKECGLDDVYLLNGFNLEVYDAEEFVSIENVEGLWKAIGLNLVTKKKYLVPSEIRFLRQQMDMTQSELASLLRVDDQTFARWEKGKSKAMPGPADLALRSLYLSASIAQPEGNEILTKWLDLIERLVGSDSGIEEMFIFGKTDISWALEKRAA